jgi:exoribonuclease-2
VEFRVQGDRKLAVAERPEGKKNWVFIDERGQSHTLKPQRIDYEIAPGYDATDIPAFLDSIQDYLDPSNLEVAWELLVEAGEAVTPADLAQLLYESQEPPVCYAAHMLLADDRLYFKKKGDVYEPRPSSQVEELKHQIAVAAQREQEREAFLARLQAALAAGEVEWQDSDRPRLEALEKYVLYPEQTHKAAQDLLSSLQRPTTPEEAFELLVQVGWWSSHENLSLRRSSYPVQFSQKVIDVAQSRLDSFPPDRDRDRLDLTHLKVYTIDDESTEEIDDGLSVEILPDGRTKLWIHIADPTRFVTLNDELDLEARRRSTTMYLPTGMIPMFPKELAVGPMSLVQGQECGALSFGVILDEVGAIADFSIHASRIKPTYRLTYLDVDEMLELAIQAEPEIIALNEAAQLRRL